MHNRPRLHTHERPTATQVTELDLAKCELRYVELAEYPNLTKLLLSHNLLKGLEGTGIARLVHLEELDLRCGVQSPHCV